MEQGGWKMIHEEKIKEFKQVAISGPTVEIDYALPEIFETMEKLWKVARAADHLLTALKLPVTHSEKEIILSNSELKHALQELFKEK